MLDILYLVPNVNDPAVARRVSMLREGHANVLVAGFHRDEIERDAGELGDYVDLGATFDARFGQRIMAVIRAARSIKSHMRARSAPDVIVARNLEMLVLATRLSSAWPQRPAIVYECLDIHRLLLRNDLAGRALRGLERRAAHRASLLMTSSMAFVREYFEAYRQIDLPILVVENKTQGTAARGTNPVLRQSHAAIGDPLRIGWFGALRCKKSLAILAEFSKSMNGAVEVVLRGRPALTEFDDFHGFIAAQPFMTYEGPYRPSDLPAIYSDVHFAWTIDYFEAGQNSDWLLPNRFYEGCLHGAIPIALDGTETAAFLRAHGLGVVLPDTAQRTLAEIIGGLDQARLRDLAINVASKRAGLFSYDADDCRALVARLAEAANLAVEKLAVAA